MTGILSLVAIMALVFLTRHLPAGFSNHALTYHAKINGASFGLVHSVQGLDGSQEKGDYFLVQLERKFVTEPSLYHWAKSTSQQQSDSSDISLVATDENGEPLKTIDLRNCQPLSWTIEADDTESGGFYEKITVAVRDIVEAH